MKSYAEALVVRAAWVAIFLVILGAGTRAETHTVKLLSASIAWATAGDRLYWSVNGGLEWKDITPLPTGFKGATLEQVFFRGPSEGWVLLSHRSTGQKSDSPRWEGKEYEIAHTGNGGIDWSFAPFTFPKSPTEPWRRSDSLNPKDLYFSDSLHGWLVVRLLGGSGAQPGDLLSTVDGGNSWNWTGTPHVAGKLIFISPKDGWLAGGPDDRELHATHDGAQTWQEIRLPLPPQVNPGSYTVFETPFFADSVHGLLAVKYPGIHGVKQSKLAVFSSTDAGKTWKLTKVFSYSAEKGEFSVTFASGKLIVPTSVDDEHAWVTQISLNDTSAPDIGAPGGVSGLSFYDAEHGAVMSIPGILMTSDGGANWKNVTPWLRTTSP